MSIAGMFRPGMRGYIIPQVAGLALAVSAFLPWVRVSDVTLAGYPDMLALWIIGLGILASVLATLSLITRKNSRHPLLVIGLAALGIMVLSWKIMPIAIGDRALTMAQALAIVNETPQADAPVASVGFGIYLGLLAAAAISAFGLTIVVKRVAQPYAITSPDDDVD
jgi:hypothetical protein